MENKDNQGAAFKVKDRKSDKHPMYTGSITVDGVDHWLSIWVNEAKSTGEKYFSLQVTVKDGGGKERLTKKEDIKDELDDLSDLPF